MSIAFNEDAKYSTYHTVSSREKSLSVLSGIMNGIAMNRKVVPAEIAELKHWIQINKEFYRKPPYSNLYNVVLTALEDNILTPEEIDDIIWVCGQLQNKNVYYDAVTHGIQMLHGILHGILSDSVVDDLELEALQHWMEDHQELQTFYPYDEIYSAISSVLADGIVSEEEQGFLIAVFSDFIDTEVSMVIDKPAMDALRKELHIDGICAFCPTITIPNKLFCFTGKSSRGKRDEIENAITCVGGLYKDTVVNDTHYLIVGDNGNPYWAFSCYGRKVEKAVKLRKTGFPITIIHENDFWDSYQDVQLT